MTVPGINSIPGKIHISDSIHHAFTGLSENKQGIICTFFTPETCNQIIAVVKELNSDKIYPITITDSKVKFNISHLGAKIEYMIIDESFRENWHFNKIKAVLVSIDCRLKVKIDAVTGLDYFKKNEKSDKNGKTDKNGDKSTKYDKNGVKIDKRASKFMIQDVLKYEANQQNLNLVTNYKETYLNGRPKNSDNSAPMAIPVIEFNFGDDLLPCSSSTNNTYGTAGSVCIPFWNVQLYSTLVCTLDRDTHDQNYIWINKTYKWKEVRQVELKVFQFITFFVTKSRTSKDRNPRSKTDSKSDSKNNQTDEKISKIAIGTDENKQENKNTNESSSVEKPENKVQTKPAENTNENKVENKAENKAKKSNRKNTEHHRQTNNESCSSQLFLVNKHSTLPKDMMAKFIIPDTLRNENTCAVLFDTLEFIHNQNVV